MLPQFFDMIGIDAQGLTFERIFWAIVFAAGLVVLAREILARRPFEDAWYGYGIGGALGIYGGFYLDKALFRNELYFGDSGLSISNYGLAIALAFVLGIILAMREARRGAGPPTAGHVFDLCFWILVASMVGSRVLFIAVGWREYLNLCIAPELVEGSGGVSDCFAAIKFWRGGLVFFGGFIGAVLAAVIYCRRKNVPFLRVADALIPSVALGHFLGRLGCLSAGCCFGRTCEVPWGITMPYASAAFVAQREALLPTDPERAMELYRLQESFPIHPTQLYEATGELMFFVLLLFLRARRTFYGQLLAVWLVLYSVMRFVVELYRGDKIRGFVFEWAIAPVNAFLGMAADEPTLFSTSQAISVATGALGVWLYVRQRRRTLVGVAA